jgi:hypothetical protein
MPPKNKFANLKYEKMNTQFNDNRKMITGYIEGKFTSEDIKTKLQQLADGFHKSGRNIYIGVSIHYGDPNAWLPAIMKHVSEPVDIFDPSDSDGSYDYSDIDGCLFYILEKPQGEVLTQKMHTVKKPKPDENINMFL